MLLMIATLALAALVPVAVLYGIALRNMAWMEGG